MCIISPLLLLAPEVAQHASARNCNSTEWQFLSLPSTLTYSVSHSNTHTHTHTSHTYVNVSHHFKHTHRTIFLLSRFPTTPSSSISPSFAHPRSTYHFLSRSRPLLPSSQRTYTHAPSSPLYFLYFPLTFSPFTPDYRRFDLLKPRAIEPYTSFILKQNRAFAASWCRCRMRPLITC